MSHCICISVLRNGGQLYTLLKSQIQSEIRDGNFSVDSSNSGQQVETYRRVWSFLLTLWYFYMYKHIPIPHSSLQRNILRIGLHSLGSPLWLDDRGFDTPTPSPSPSHVPSHTPSPTLPQFLHTLRGLLRRAYAVAVITIPTHLMQVYYLT